MRPKSALADCKCRCTVETDKNLGCCVAVSQDTAVCVVRLSNTECLHRHYTHVPRIYCYSYHILPRRCEMCLEPGGQQFEHFE
jgi:hypothetical protein